MIFFDYFSLKITKFLSFLNLFKTNNLIAEDKLVSMFLFLSISRIIEFILFLLYSEISLRTSQNCSSMEILVLCPDIFTDLFLIKSSSFQIKLKIIKVTLS